MVMEKVEKTLGLPKLSKVAESLDKFPDSVQLRLIKDVLNHAETVAQIAPQLDQVINLIKELNSMPMEKLERLAKVLKSIERILKNAPDDLVQLLGSLKEE